VPYSEVQFTSASVSFGEIKGISVRALCPTACRLYD
jgi:hypothetical protein